MHTITTEKLLDRIHCAEEHELNGICNALTERFAEIHPEWELLTLSVHGHDPESQLKALQACIEFIQAQK